MKSYVALIPCLLVAAPLVQAFPSSQAADAVLQHYQFQMKFLQLYSQALESQNASVAIASIYQLRDDFIQWGQDVAANIERQDFHRARHTRQGTQARMRLEEEIIRIQNESSRRSCEGTNFILLNASFRKACADFTQVVQSFEKAMRP